MTSEEAYEAKLSLEKAKLEREHKKEEIARQKAEKKKKNSVQSATRSNNKKQSSKKQSKKRKENEYRCIYCSELYCEPPAETWIECKKCHKWCHESCTILESGEYHICQICK